MGLRKIDNYLDEAKSRLGLDSDYKLAKVLEVQPGVVSNWRSGKRGLDTFHAMQLAEITGIDPLELIAATEAERESDPRKKASWETWAKKLQGIAAACVFLALPLLLLSQDANASSLSLQQLSRGGEHFILC